MSHSQASSVHSTAINQAKRLDAGTDDVRPVVGFEDVATITLSGAVTTVDRVIRHRCNTTRILPGGRILKPKANTGGFIHMRLNRDCKHYTLSLARLITEAWIRPLETDECVRHKDGDTSNCHIDNLIIVPRSQARKYSTLVTGKRCNLQRKAEIWRDVPQSRAQISNFGRLRSNATMTPSILTPVTVDNRRIVAFVRQDGRRTSSTIGHLMRVVFPELRLEYQIEKRKRRSDELPTALPTALQAAGR